MLAKQETVFEKYVWSCHLCSELALESVRIIPSEKVSYILLQVPVKLMTPKGAYKV